MQKKKDISAEEQGKLNKWQGKGMYMHTFPINREKGENAGKKTT